MWLKNVSANASNSIHLHYQWKTCSCFKIYWDINIPVNCVTCIPIWGGGVNVKWFYLCLYSIAPSKNPFGFNRTLMPIFQVLNRDFEETCSVNTDMRSVLYILFNPVRDELITGGVGGIAVRCRTLSTLVLSLLSRIFVIGV